jgi:hypothetical protein
MFRCERYFQTMDELDNLAIEALYQKRVAGRDPVGARSLEEAARELGFDHDEIFQGSEIDDAPKPGAVVRAQRRSSTQR